MARGDELAAETPGPLGETGGLSEYSTVKAQSVSKTGTHAACGSDGGLFVGQVLACKGAFLNKLCRSIVRELTSKLLDR